MVSMMVTQRYYSRWRAWTTTTGCCTIFAFCKGEQNVQMLCAMTSCGCLENIVAQLVKPSKVLIAKLGRRREWTTSSCTVAPSATSIYMDRTTETQIAPSRRKTAQFVATHDSRKKTRPGRFDLFVFWHCNNNHWSHSTLLLLMINI